MRRLTLHLFFAVVFSATLRADVQPPSVEVLSPNGGELCRPGQEVQVAWRADSSNGIRSVDLLVSYDNGVTFETVQSGLPGSGSFGWVPDSRPTGVAIVRVEAVDGAGAVGIDECDGVFSIGDSRENREEPEEAGSGGGAPTTPLPTTIQDFKLAGTQPGIANPIIDPVQGECTFCHKTDPVFRQWQGTMMANASVDPVFEACLAIAEQDAPGSGDLCLRCHIPKAWLEGRSTPTNGSAVLATDKSGVSCNFCHRMVNPIFVESPGAPELGSPQQDLSILAQLASQGEQPPIYGNGMYVIDPVGGMPHGYIEGSMRGPRVTTSPGHNVLVSPFHRESDFCGTCHDVSNPAYTRNAAGKFVPNGFNQRAADPSPEKLMPIERTYSEWLHSEFAERPVHVEGYGSVQSCQDCHMSGPPDKACFMGAVRDDVVNHDLTGGNAWVPRLLADLYPDRIDPTTLGAAAARAVLTLTRAARLQVRQDETDLRVTVTNLTGHKLPTGYPEGRRMWLQVKFKNKDGEVIKVSGNYDTSTGVLTEDPEIKVYEVRMGIDSAVSSLTGIPAGHTFHFALNNVILKDNRIPPRGFTNDAFRSFGGAPVGYLYRDGQSSDATDYSIPLDAASAQVTLYYQTASKEYIEFLRDANVSNDRGRLLHNLWVDSKSPPNVMAQETIELNALTTVFVDRNASGAATGTNWDDAFTDLEDALAAADANECITHLEIAGGTYTPHALGALSTFRVRGKLRISGGYGIGEAGSFIHDPDRFETVLDGRKQVRHVVTIAGGPSDIPASLSYLTIRGGNATGVGGDGGGIYGGNRQFTLQNCRLLDNTASERGGAVFSQNGRVVLDTVDLRGNRAVSGGAVWTEATTLAATSTIFDDNDATGDGGAVRTRFGADTFTNCAFTRNRAANGGGLFLDTAVLAMTNCTLAANVASAQGGGMRLRGTVTPNTPPKTVFNSIFWRNSDGGAVVRAAQVSSEVPVEISYSAVEDATAGDGDVLPGSGNVDRDPLLFDATGGVVTLRRESPAIDAGDSTRVTQRLDLRGRPRRVDDAPTADGGVGPAPVVDMGAVEHTRTLYVDADATGLFEDGRSWKNAYRELRDALAEANEPGSQVEEILVAEGTYRPAPPAALADRLAAFRLRDGLALLGGFPGEDGDDSERDPAAHPTLLSGDLRANDSPLRIGSNADNSLNVVTLVGAGAEASLDGFSIRGGNADTGALRGSQGGGVYVDRATLTLKDCQITGNRAGERGGGAVVLNGGSLVCERCVFRINRADAGGALAIVNGSARLLATRLQSNAALDGSGGAILALDGSSVVISNGALALNRASQNGGGIFASGSSLTLIQSTIARNQAESTTGGALALNGAFVVANTILWGNSDSVGDSTSAQLANAGSVSYSCVQGGWSSGAPGDVGNIALDPRFVFAGGADLRLSAGSPCIDAGSNDALPVGVTTDLLGNPRRIDVPGVADTGRGPAPIVDMGAHEALEEEVAEGRGDGNSDGRVNRTDAALFVESMMGPDVVAIAAARKAFDADRDQDIDLRDFIAFQETYGRAGAPAPDRLDVRVTSGDAAQVTVEPGEEIPYEVRGLLVERTNQGLAAVVFDLSFSGGPLGAADLPSDGPMRSFTPFDGITNPAGFGGTPIEGVLAQVGGAQNTLGTTSGDVPFPTGKTVERGVGLKEVILARGVVRAPATAGSFQLEVFNVGGSVLGSAPGGVARVVPVGPLLEGRKGALLVKVAGGGLRFRRADSNGDGRVDISDASFTLAALFRGGELPACLDASDANDDGRVDLSDAVATLSFLFRGATPPPLPGVRVCGEDPTADSIDCREYGECP